MELVDEEIASKNTEYTGEACSHITWHLIVQLVHTNAQFKNIMVDYLNKVVECNLLDNGGHPRDIGSKRFNPRHARQPTVELWMKAISDREATKAALHSCRVVPSPDGIFVSILTC